PSPRPAGRSDHRPARAARWPRGPHPPLPRLLLRRDPTQFLRRLALDRRQVAVAQPAIERFQVAAEHPLELLELDREALRQLLEDRVRLRRRPAIAGFDDVQQRGDLVVELDRVVERVLIAAVPDLVDLLLDLAQ